jgi:hypothetical protein
LNQLSVFNCNDDDEKRKKLVDGLPQMLLEAKIANSLSSLPIYTEAEKERILWNNCKEILEEKKLAKKRILVVKS